MSKLTNLLLEWYKINGRDLPWRVKGGAHSDPYAVLVSEFMLQQTTVKTVKDYFERFMKTFPTVRSLAEASLEDVYQAWQGLGYYTRARSLHQTAQMVCQNFGGVFPDTKEKVLQLKGIGAYTAASFLAFAFNKPETVVDGNVIRVICRLYHLTEPSDDIMQKIRQKAEKLTSKECPADYASAIMDLGATVCTPKKPQCFRCPWQACCRSKDKKDLEQIPFRKRISPVHKEGFVYIIRNQKGQVFVRKRTEKGLLSGLYEFPWNEKIFYRNFRKTKIVVSHVFTHIHLKLKVVLVEENNLEDGLYIYPKDFSKYATSTLMKKVFAKIKSLKII